MAPTRIVFALLAAPVILAAAAFTSSGPLLVNVAPTSNGTRIVADTQFSDKHAGSNAGDGRIGPGDACWYSKDGTTLPCALTFELAQPEKLRRAVLHQAQWSGSMYHTKDFALEVSDDGKTWRRVATGQLADDNNARATVDLTANVRWFRVVVLTSYIPFQTCGLAEVELLAERPASVGQATFALNGRPAIISDDVHGMSLAFVPSGAQAAVFRRTGEVLADLRAGESTAITLPVAVQEMGFIIEADAELESGASADVTVDCAGVNTTASLSPTGSRTVLSVRSDVGGEHELRIVVRCRAEGAVRISGIRLIAGEHVYPVTLAVSQTDYGTGAPPQTPELREAMQRAMIEWDWQAQDGIGVERNPVSYRTAVARTIERGQQLALALSAVPSRGSAAPRLASRWSALVAEHSALAAAAPDDGYRLRDVYLRLRWAKREMLLAHPDAKTGPIVFAKQVPGCFSHQLTQYYGRYARPGGGIYVLDKPGESLSARPIVADQLPLGSYMQPEISWDADRIYFAYCRTDSVPADRIQGHRGRHYHLYSVRPDGSGLKQLTEGAEDDFAPRVLPDGKLVFISTRRGGWHRCGTPGCENYVLTVGDPDGKRLRPISFHETQEWDPAVLADGRIVYTRWDYVDRAAVFYQQLWTTWPDGTRAAALFGNNTFNPVGIWEARPVPGSRGIMATAGAHHAMTAGSIILVDPAAGVDGLDPISRLTPDAPFPESEAPLAPAWYAPKPGTEPRETEESRRWPGHAYRSPFPLSENMFVAAYSFRGLIGEPNANHANMFGIYLCDADGNRELLYRDANIASLWPQVLRARKRPPALPSTADRSLGDDGIFVLQDVYASLPKVKPGSVKALRVVQVLPKSTSGIDNPPVGLPSGSPGKQVLGTVPVEADGSAHFRAPARKELAFQALDADGMAVQVMRSGVYLQPGERITCVGCHENRNTAPRKARALAASRPPSRILRGPDGSKPFSYPLLVQPLLDLKCIACHSGPSPSGSVDLTNEPEGHYTRSYLALAKRVPFSDMGSGEALSKPGRYGAVGSSLMKMLREGHQGVRLTRQDIQRLATWMDVSALFYGTFDPADQARQRRGERILGPKLE